MLLAPAGKMKEYSSVNLSSEKILIVLSFDADMNRVGWLGIDYKLVTHFVWEEKVWINSFFFCNFQTITDPKNVDVKKYLYFWEIIMSVM